MPPLLFLLPPFERVPPLNDEPPLLRELPNELREPNDDVLLRLLLPNDGLD